MSSVLPEGSPPPHRTSSAAPLGHEEHSTVPPRPSYAATASSSSREGISKGLAALLALLTFLLGTLFGGGVTHLLDARGEGHHHPHGLVRPLNHPGPLGNRQAEGDRRDSDRRGPSSREDGGPRQGTQPLQPQGTAGPAPKS